MVTVRFPERETSLKRTPKWCKRCGRKHSRFDPCKLEAVTRIAKSGREVARLALSVKES